MNAKHVGVMNEREGLLLLRNQNVYIIVGSLCPNENEPGNRGRSYIMYMWHLFKRKNKKYGNLIEPGKNLEVDQQEPGGNLTSDVAERGWAQAQALHDPWHSNWHWPGRVY